MPEPSLTLVLGGARSGKSTHAEGLIAELAPPWTYVATAESFDTEMDERIRLHRERRDGRWQTLDAPLDLAGTLCAVPEGRPVLVDCLTLWLSNHLLAEHDLDGVSDALLDALRHPRGPWVVVSNEVGLGIVPDNALARRFRDAAGRLNQRVAAIADHAVFIAAGLPIRLK
ncbi:MAG: bifunctional adenosylcobinamide kinase/adenosylcobinamide-phosphate guanylyltransferase [Methylobacterium mesophilicum]|nr:bifunctional adenosylcobinamide kinase/adenosylcobinamide-phosphate guanylyltransferase [Methylobacterium mesophilicum]